MTLDKVKELLQDLKNAKRRVRRINAQMEEYASIQSSLTPKTGHGKGCVLSPVENIVLRLEKERLNLAAALDEMFALEDRLSETINQLAPTEQDVIIGYYMQCRTHWQLAQEVGYCEKQIKRIKNKAIAKLSEHL